MKNQLPPKPKRWLYHPWQQGSSTCDKRQWVFHIDVEELWPTIFGRIVFIQAHSRVLSHQSAEYFPKSLVYRQNVFCLVFILVSYGTLPWIFFPSVRLIAESRTLTLTETSEAWRYCSGFWHLIQEVTTQCVIRIILIESLKVRHSFLHFCG